MAKNKVNDIFVKIACLLASIALWVFIVNTTNPTQRMTFNNVPVQIQNAEGLQAKGLILVPDQSPTTRVHLEGAVSDLYTINQDSINVILDLNQRTLFAGEQEVQATYVQAPAGVVLSGSNPTVRLKVDEYIRRPVEIKKDHLKYQPASGFFVPEPSLEMNYVTVSGPKTEVERVAAVKPVSQISNINKVTREVVRLEAMDATDQPVSNVTLSESYVEVTYTPQPVKEVPIEAIWEGSNQAINLTGIRANPDTVLISAREAILNAVTELKTVPLDLREVEPGETRRIKGLVVPAEITLLDSSGEPMANEVEVITQADPITTREYSKTVTFVGDPRTGKLVSQPVTVRVTVSGVQNMLDELGEGNIIVSADISKLDRGTHDIPVKVDLPKDFALIQTVPSTVSVHIE